MKIRLIDHNSIEYAAMLQMRVNVLLHPIGVPASFIKEDEEKTDFLIGAFTDVLIGCCVLTPARDDVVQLRQMAVRKDCQGSGVGTAIIRFAERLAKGQGYTKLMMHARDEVIPFYVKCGYVITGEPFNEVGVAHHIMQKSL